ncbi:MAG TPA: ATP-binding protein [Gammaproteobacteria bacterium]|nr:ATP-binding protein [Gammaproteobacteria bacterium]
MQTTNVRPVIRQDSRRRPGPAPAPVQSVRQQNAPGRVVVAIDGGRNSEQVVRAGRRFAHQLHVPWTIVTVDTGRAPGAAVRERLERAFRLAERLGGNTVVLRGSDIAAEIVAYARDHHATNIVIGRTRERPFAGFFRQALTQRLLRHNEDFEITVIGAAPDEPMPRHRRWEASIGALKGSPWHHYSYALIIVAICIAISAALALALPLAMPYLLLIFLTGVVVVAAHTSLVPALTAAVASSLAFNFFFMEPIFGFAISPVGELIALFLFLIVAIFGSNFANRLRIQVAALRATNAQSQALLALSKKLVEAPELTAVHRAAVEAIAEFERVPACLIIADAGSRNIEIVASAPAGLVLDDDAREAAFRAFEHGHSSGYLSETWASVGWRFVPLVLKENRYGVLGVKFDELPIRPRSEQLLLLDALANQVALSLARTRLASNLEQARVAEETERLRSALLSSVSHDLRTPLSSMIGSASTLRDLGDRLSEADKREMVDAVLSEGRRLNRYIENLLDMTRLGSGTLNLHRDWVTLADIVASALQRTREIFAGLRVVRDIPADLPLLYVQPALVEQALVNILENAARFSSPGDELRVAARQEHERMLMTVTDQGPGIPAADRTRVFDMFFTGAGGDTGPHGSGLGLAICEGIVAAHGGSIEALAGPGGRGTTIAIRLPLSELPPESSDDQADALRQ